MAKTIAGTAADNRVDRRDIEAHLRVPVGPKGRQTEIVVDAAIRKQNALHAARAVAPIEGPLEVKGRQQQRISS